MPGAAAFNSNESTGSRLFPSFFTHLRRRAVFLKQVEKKASGTANEVCKDLCKTKVYTEEGFSETWSLIQKGDPPPLEGMIAKVGSGHPSPPCHCLSASAGPPAATYICTSIASHLLLPLFFNPLPLHVNASSVI